jgi:hypothetical protein
MDENASDAAIAAIVTRILSEGVSIDVTGSRFVAEARMGRAQRNPSHQKKHLIGSALLYSLT